MKKIFIVFAMLLGLTVGAGLAEAQSMSPLSVKVPEALNPSNFFLGAAYTYQYLDNAYSSTHMYGGWYVEAGYKLDLFGIGEKDFAIVVEGGAHYKGKLTHFTGLAGLRYFMPELFGGFTPYVHGMAGFGNFNFDHKNKFIYGAGVGGLVPINKHLSIKALQFDLLHQTGYNSANVVRLSTGAVITF